MSDFDIKTTLECKPDRPCTEVTFHNRGGYPIHIRFTDKDVTVVGDYGCWVFKGNICNPYRFFCGNHINPDYWAEKLNAAPRTYWDRGVDEDRLKKTLLEEYQDYGVTAEDLEHLCSDRDTIESWGDAVIDLNDLKGWDISHEDLWMTVTGCIADDWCYLQICELVQTASNYLRDHGIDKKS